MFSIALDLTSKKENGVIFRGGEVGRADRDMGSWVEDGGSGGRGGRGRGVQLLEGGYNPRSKVVFQCQIVN